MSQSLQCRGVKCGSPAPCIRARTTPVAGSRREGSLPSPPRGHRRALALQGEIASGTAEVLDTAATPPRTGHAGATGHLAHGVCIEKGQRYPGHCRPARLGSALGKVVGQIPKERTMKDREAQKRAQSTALLCPGDSPSVRAVSCPAVTGGLTSGTGSAGALIYLDLSKALDTVPRGKSFSQRGKTGIRARIETGEMTIGSAERREGERAVHLGGQP